jgi:exodeoxyribonuclease VII small subunit
MSKKKFVYKEALQDLESIIHKIESEEPDVDELSVMVKNALLLLSQCKEKLRETEQDINKALGEAE